MSIINTTPFVFLQQSQKFGIFPFLIMNRDHKVQVNPETGAVKYKASKQICFKRPECLDLVFFILYSALLFSVCIMISVVINQASIFGVLGSFMTISIWIFLTDIFQIVSVKLDRDRDMRFASILKSGKERVGDIVKMVELCVACLKSDDNETLIRTHDDLYKFVKAVLAVKRLSQDDEVFETVSSLLDHYNSREYAVSWRFGNVCI